MAEYDSSMFPDLIREVHAKDSVEHLHKAQAFVESTSKKRKAVEIKTPGGVVMTTRPDRWDERNEVVLRGSAAMNQKKED